MNLLKQLLTRLRHPFSYGKPGFRSIKYGGKPLNPDISEAVEAVLAPPLPAAPPQPKGRVIKQTRQPEFDPEIVNRRSGGRIVKVMPKQLQQIKAAQEKVENDEITRIES